MSEEKPKREAELNRRLTIVRSKLKGLNEDRIYIDRQIEVLEREHQFILAQLDLLTWETRKSD